MTNNAANIRPTDSCNINIAGIGSTINFATILTNNTAKVLGVLTFSVKHYTVKSIGNSAAEFINTGYSSDKFVAGNTATVYKVVIFFICRNLTGVAACNATYIVFTEYFGRAIVNEIGKCCSLRIVANHATNVVSTGNSAVVASIGNTAGVTANKPTNVLTDIICTFIFAGNAGCINNISNCTTSTIFTNNTAYFIFAADDTFVIATVHIAIVYADNAANIIAEMSTTVCYAKAVNVLYIAICSVYANYAAKTRACSFIGCNSTIAVTVAKRTVISTNQTACNCT